MRKFGSLLLVTAMAFSLFVGCGSSSGGGASNSASSTSDSAGLKYWFHEY